MTLLIFCFGGDILEVKFYVSQQRLIVSTSSLTKGDKLHWLSMSDIQISLFYWLWLYFIKQSFSIFFCKIQGSLMLFITMLCDSEYDEWWISTFDEQQWTYRTAG